MYDNLFKTTECVLHRTLDRNPKQLTLKKANINSDTHQF